jgi:hypothetical protein
MKVMDSITNNQRNFGRQLPACFKFDCIRSVRVFLYAEMIEVRLEESGQHIVELVNVFVRAFDL